MKRAALALARVAVERIDMRRHQGVHPRIGALDVMPFVPLAGSSMADAVEVAHTVGHALAIELALPVFFYGAAARSPARRALAALRIGGFEGLTLRLAQADGVPDAGLAAPHPTAGAAVVGARDVLIAFNAVLDSADIATARTIARAIRESSGGLPAVRAIAVPLPSRGRLQIAMNLLDYRRTPIPAVTQRLEEEAGRANVAVLEYELVGCAPADAFAEPLARPVVNLAPSRLLDPSLLAR